MDRKSDSYLKAQPYLAALRELARTGHTALNLEENPLLRLPIVVDQSGENAPPEIKADTFVIALEAVITNRLTGNDRKKAEALFAFDEYAGMPLQGRYHAVAKLHDARSGKWENFRKEPLDDLLVTVLTALHREAVALSTSRPSEHKRTPTGTQGTDRRALIGGDFEVANYEVQYNLPSAPGQPRETMEIREIRATSDGLVHWRLGSRYWGKNPEEAPSISIFGPGRLEVVRDERLTQAPTAGRAHIMRVAFPQPLKRGETTRFGLVRRQDVDFDDLIRSGWRDQRDVTPVVPIDHAEIGVRFPADHRPATVWHFEDVPEYLGPGAPDVTNLLEPDASGYVVFSWTDLLVGHSYGIAWRW